MAFPALAYLAIILLGASDQASAHASGARLVGNRYQCGGKGFSCTGSNCHDGEWVGYACDMGLTCLRDNEQWWHCGRRTELGGPPGAQLVWADEFDGNSLDTSHWNMELGDGAAYPELSGGWWGWGNDEQQCYTSSPSNIKVADGLLTITAKHQPGGTPCVNYNIYTNISYETSRTAWTSAKITSANKREFKWFEDGSPIYVEARVQASAVQAARSPGFWFLAAPPSPYGRWPDSGEIDVGRHASPAPAAAPVAPAGFQVWAIEWAPTYIAWILNGHEVHRSPSSEWHTAAAPDKPGAPFDQPFYAIFNLAIDHVTCPPGQACAPLDPSTSQFSVDYIRAWKVPKATLSNYNGPTPPAVPELFHNVPLYPSASEPSESDAEHLVTLQATQQCGGLGGSCGAAGSSCLNAPWPGFRCASGLHCMYSSDSLWACGSRTSPPPVYTVTATTRFTSAIEAPFTQNPACSDIPLQLSTININLEHLLSSRIAGAKVHVSSSILGCQAPGRRLSEISQVTVTATASVAAWISLSQMQAVVDAAQLAVNPAHPTVPAGSLASKPEVTVVTTLGKVVQLQQAGSEGSGGGRFGAHHLPSLYSVGAAQLSGAGLALVGAIACLAGIAAAWAAASGRSRSSARTSCPLRQGFEHDSRSACVVFVGGDNHAPSLPHSLAQHAKAQPMEEPLLGCCLIPTPH